MTHSLVLKASSSLGVLFLFSSLALSSCDEDKSNDPEEACISPLGSGGAILLNACPQWNENGLQDLRCDASPDGYGGEGTVPALARICEHLNLDDGKGTSRQYLECMDKAGITGDPCRDNQEELVRECLLTPLAFCETSPDDVCQEVMAACPGVSFGACYFGLTDDGLVDDDAEIACFRDEISEDETCEARFLRCAWDY